MISNSNNSPEEQLLFSNPETLQQLRQQLLSLVLQDQQSLQTIERDFQTYFNQNQQPTSSQESETSPLSPITLDFLREAYFHLKEKSSCISTLAQLSVRMIDCIREQQHQYCSALQRYQIELDTLREQNQCLASKNDYIENDVEYFREHLRAAENELQHIVNQQDKDEEEQGDMNAKDLVIEKLQEQLAKIKGELEYYKFSSRSKKSLFKLNDPFLLPIRSQHTLLSSTSLIPSGNSLETDYNSIIQKLQIQNEGLRRQIHHFESKPSRKSSKQFIQIKEELVQQTERLHCETPSDNINLQEKVVTKTPSLSIFQKGILHDFRESLESPRSRFEEEYYQTPASQLLEGLRTHGLSNEWSTKSFELHGDVRPAKLIYLNQEEQDLHAYEKGHKYENHNPVIQQTKETEGSIKDIQLIAHPKVQKQVEHIGVNTDFIEEPKMRVQPDILNNKIEKDNKTILERLLQFQPPLLRKMSNFIVEKRVRRNITKANQSMLLIIC